MKKQINQSWWLLLAAILFVGVGTSAFAQERNKHFALNNLSAVTVNENFGLNTAPWSFSFTKPNSLFATNFNLLVADDYPKPDFSGIEEWYEVVKYYYDFAPTLPSTYLVVKKKVYKAPLNMEMTWFDEDGVVIYRTRFPNLLRQEGTEVGEPIRLQGGAPYERLMSKVKSVVVKKKNCQSGMEPC
jgi:hypothetical protein